jgi:hypothetical protein
MVSHVVIRIGALAAILFSIYRAILWWLAYLEREDED